MESVTPSRAPLSHFELVEGLTGHDQQVLQLLARAVERGLFESSSLATALATMQQDSPWEHDGEIVISPEMVKALAGMDDEDVMSAADQTLAMAASVAVVGLETRQRVQWLTERLERLTFAVQGAATVMLSPLAQ